MTKDRVFDMGQIVSGRYRVSRFVDRGGMGEVYAAEDLELHEPVALKTLRPEIAGDTQSIARFKHEIQLSRKVSHPNVCHVYDLARDPATGPLEEAVVYLSMELLEGETLEARVRRAGPLSADDALPLIRQMALALDAAHDAGIIHRDFKPANVMLVPATGGERAVVTDFGLARSSVVLGDEGQTETMTRLMGTPPYMAPELFAGGQAGIASDVYALGVTVHFMVTGKLPPRTKSKRYVVTPDSSSAVLDARWTRAVQRALDPDPGRRFAHASDIVAALEGRSPGNGRGLTISRRNTAWIGVAGTTLLAGTIGWRSWGSRRILPSAEASQYYQLGIDDIYAAAYFAATKALQQAVKLAPHFSLAHARLAQAWMELEESDKAGREMLLARRDDGGGMTAEDRLHLDAIELSITREFPPRLRSTSRC